MIQPRSCLEAYDCPMRKLDMVAVVIPCYKVQSFILPLIEQIGQEIDLIYVVDDACPHSTGQYVQEHCQDQRVKVIFHHKNQGVGGAVISGYHQALQDDASIIIKMDGDGQMNPFLIPLLISPIVGGKADYVKGNRFFDLNFLSTMPKIRVFGNAALSLISKVCTGYWNIMDPTNGYTAIHANILYLIPLHKLDKRYFFESDLLFRLSTVRAVVLDVPMRAKYDDEISSLRIGKVVWEFPNKYLTRLLKRIFYTYFLRDFNVGSVELVVGLFLITLGALYGGYNWYYSLTSKVIATSGTVMIAALPIILGFQLLLAAIHYDVMNVPKEPIYRFLKEHIAINVNSDRTGNIQNEENRINRE